MPYIRMKRIFLQGLLWLYLLLEFGYTALSLEPGYLDFDNLPDTNFSCLGKVIGGYYADLETNCQMFHVCTIGQLDEPMDIRFLCLNGTVFDQETRVCERIDEVDCSKSERFYGLNLELYGNTQPPILEDSPETEQPLLIKSTTSATSTTSKPKVTNTPFYPSAKPPTVTTQAVVPHHFPVANSPDIRFNPEEINISLHPGAPPDIRTKPATYQQQSFSDNNKKVVVTTHSENSDNKKVSVTTQSQVFDDGKVLNGDDFGERPQTQKPLHHSFGHSGSQSNKNFRHSTPSDINYEFTFRQTESSIPDFHTELPSFFHSDFHSDQDYAGHHHNPQNQQFKSSTFHDDFTPTTKGENRFQPKIPTTIRNYFLQSLKPPAPNQPHHYNQHQTEKPQRVQLPLPLLPTLPPLTFSSPAPFALQHHIDTKRYTKDHPSPPRIVISASASVSDASGRRLNYSLGTIGAAEFLEQTPHSYDEYKDEDISLDPFYHDVPKLKRSRTKRDTIKHSDIIRNEEEAINVLKFLFDWYKNNEKTASESTTVPTVISTTSVTPKTDVKVTTAKELEPELTAEASSGVSKESQENSFRNSELFKENSKFNIIGNNGGQKNIQERSTREQVKTTTSKTTTTTKMSKYEKDFLDELFGHEDDYVNDNFEPIAYNEKYGESEKKQSTTTKAAPSKEVKNPSLPKDYVDDNIEPIYFRDKIETTSSIEKVVPSSEKAKEIETTSPSTSTHLTSNELNPVKESEVSLNQKKTDDEVKVTPVEIGDTETNNIKQNIPKEEKIESTTKPVGFSEPKSEILEPVTTEKTTTTSAKPKTTHRRGRKRYNTVTEKDKEPENKHVVLEKITERAHTAKDDFNYLRTLYKVHTTTPTYNVSGNRTSEDGTIKTQKMVEDYFDLKEASPSDKVIRTSLEDEAASHSPHLIPIITTEAATTTSERITPSTEYIIPSSIATSETIIPSSTTSTERTSSEIFIASSTSTTTEQIIPSSTASEIITSSSTTTEKPTPSTTTSERTVPSTTTSEKTTPSTTTSERTTPSTTTSERTTPSTTTSERTTPSTTTSEGTTPSTTTSKRTTPSTTTSERTTSSTTTTEHISSTTSETPILSSTTTTEKIPLSSTTSETILSSSTSTTETSALPRRDSRRRGRARFGDESVPSRSDHRNHHRRRPQERVASTPRPNRTPQAFSVTTTDEVQKKTDYKEVTIEENGSNINRNIIPYPIVTTEYNPRGGSTESMEFLTQLTLNYKKIFEDISQVAVPIVSDVLDISTLAVTETNAGTTSGKPLEEYKARVLEEQPEAKLINHQDLVPSTTTSPRTTSTTSSTVEEVIQTTITPEVVTPFVQLKSESQVLQTEEASTVGKSVKETELFNEEASETLETVPTLSVTETLREVVRETTSSHTVNNVPDKVVDTTTEKLLEETQLIETSSTTSESDKIVVTTEGTIPEPEDTKLEFAHDRKEIEPKPELTTASSALEETPQTTSSSVDDTSLIPRITDIFSFFGISKDKDIFGIPTTLLTTEQAVKSTEVFNKNLEHSEALSTQGPQEESILETSTATPKPSSTETHQNVGTETEHYPSTIYVVRTTENVQVKEESQAETKMEEPSTEENVEPTETYPSTVFVVRSTESSTNQEYTEHEMVPILRQSVQNLQKLIEEIEESTKSVVATTNVPMTNTVTTTEKPSQDHYVDIKNVIATTERRGDLQELTSLFEYTTRSNYVATTPQGAESSTVSSTTEGSREQEAPVTLSTALSDPELMSTSQIERLTISERPLATTPITVTTAAGNRRGNARRGGGRAAGRRNPEARRGVTRHRFSTESFTKRPDGRGQTIEEEIVGELTKNSRTATTESYRKRLRVRTRGRESSTDAPLQKSASATQPERVKDSLPTTPLSKQGEGKRHFIFNCFGKDVDKFYPDPRDCRLFHYCTQGYSQNQLIDMKFVCDLNTYFDEVKRICSKRKPKRCL